MGSKVGTPTRCIESGRKLNIALKDCRNCIHHKPRISPNTGRRYVWCTEFSIKITDMKNAKKCTAFKNKHPEDEVRKAQRQLKRK